MSFVIREPSFQALDVLRKLIYVCFLLGAEGGWWLISFSLPWSFLSSKEALLPPGVCWMWIPTAVATFVVAFCWGAPVVGYQCTWVVQLGVLVDVQRADEADFHLLAVESVVEIRSWWEDTNPIPGWVGWGGGKVGGGGGGGGGHCTCPSPQGTLPQIYQERLELRTWNFLTS